MRHVPSFLRLRLPARARRAVAFVAALLAVGGCRDVPEDPVAVLLTPETAGALLFPGDLPVLGALVAPEEFPEELRPELTRWTESWEMGPEEGREVRAQVHRSVAPALALRFGSEGVEALLDRVSWGVAAARNATAGLLPGRMRGAVERADGLQQRARGVLEGGRVEEALRLGLEAADALREVDAAQVASGLLRRIRRELRRNPGEGPYVGERGERVRRLVRGAEEALREGDYPRAIRRAYYASRLLGVGAP